MSTSLPLFDQLTRGEIVRMAVDPCERKHRGSETSIAAHQKVVHSKQETYKKIMVLLKSRGSFGATSKEIAYAFGVELNTISGRFSELKMMGWIKPTELRRGGASVLILNEANPFHS